MNANVADKSKYPMMPSLRTPPKVKKSIAAGLGSAKEQWRFLDGNPSDGFSFVPKTKMNGFVKVADIERTDPTTGKTELMSVYKILRKTEVDKKKRAENIEQQIATEMKGEQTIIKQLPSGTQEEVSRSVSQAARLEESVNMLSESRPLSPLGEIGIPKAKVPVRTVTPVMAQTTAISVAPPTPDLQKSDASFTSRSHNTLSSQDQFSEEKLKGRRRNLSMPPKYSPTSAPVKSPISQATTPKKTTRPRGRSTAMLAELKEKLESKHESGDGNHDPLFAPEDVEAAQAENTIPSYASLHPLSEIKEADSFPAELRVNNYEEDPIAIVYKQKLLGDNDKDEKRYSKAIEKYYGAWYIPQDEWINYSPRKKDERHSERTTRMRQHKQLLGTTLSSTNFGSVTESAVAELLNMEREEETIMADLREKFEKNLKVLQTKPSVKLFRKFLEERAQSIPEWVKTATA